MIRAAAFVLLVLASCAPNSVELLTGGQRSAAARLACAADTERCPPAIRCSGSVLVLASEGAGRAEVRSSAAACILLPAPIGRGLLSLAGVAGAVIEAVADMVAAQLRERAAVRAEVRAQAAADLSAEQARLAPPKD